MGTRNTITWWEKSVEYLYILRSIDPNTMIAPLDGNHERAGDTILKNPQNRWVLIEFKKDKQSISDEKAKYDNYAEAKAILGNKDGHHFLVYGFECNKTLELKAKRYFSESDVNPECILESGTSLNSFIDYINTLLDYKKQSDSSSPFGGVAVTAVTNEGIICTSFEEFQFSMNIEIAPPSQKMRM